MTPFANVLIDPLDDHENLGKTLYPLDFILTEPIPHMGLNEFFPDSLEMDQTHASQVKIIPYIDADGGHWKMDGIDFEEQGEMVTSHDDIPDSLVTAVIDCFDWCS